MELLREQLMYKDNQVTICMAKLSPAEQYECIRLLLATRTKDVQICTHDATNEYITALLKQVQGLQFVQCWKLSLLPSLPVDASPSQLQMPQQ
jgi:hypothetical protein